MVKWVRHFEIVEPEKVEEKKPEGLNNPVLVKKSSVNGKKYEIVSGSEYYWYYRNHKATKQVLITEELKEAKYVNAGRERTPSEEETVERKIGRPKTKGVASQEKHDAEEVAEL